MKINRPRKFIAASGYIFTPAVSLSFEHHAGDSTIFLGSILTPPTPSTHLTRGLAARRLFPVPRRRLQTPMPSPGFKPRPYGTAVQILIRRKNHRVEGLMHAKSAETQSSHVGFQWKCGVAAFQTTGTAVRKVRGGRPRTTTTGDDRYIILQEKRGRRQSASVIAQQLSTATGRQVSRFTVARCLPKGGLFSRRPERCLPLKVDHRRYRLQWCREHKNWTTDQWSRVLFMDGSRFSTRSDSQRVLIWREIGTRFYTSNIKERHHYGCPGVLVWGGIMLNGRTELHIFDRGSVTGDRYCEEVLLPHVRLF
ncbi:transposable element Tcb2 transposase [Trichonephila clavipes]|nr:transposable element Tcb2 transposase [Trichonephila clavipes]